jgi:hypothetical protein
MSSDPRILIPIDLHQVSAEKLETLVNIARLLRRGVLGLLLEDLQLQQLAALPFTTEISLSTARERKLLHTELSRHGSRVNTGTRERLLEIAGRHQVELSFEQATGRRLHCALERDGGLDVFFPPRQQWQHPAGPGWKRGLPINRLGLVLPSAGLGGRVMAVADALLRANLVKQVEALAGGDFNIAEIALLPLHGRKLKVQAGVSLDSTGLLQLIKRSPYDLMLIPKPCLEAVPAAELDAALAVASGQILVVGES